ncbi:DUF2471 family protein [Cupriavidus neocaledonicus]|uniref:DUF2471 domain-containing protein n=1 Tax=Cupriavidus neocaledonicus TaxID=1040979 RepID=A0A375H6B7_9BURK|nr:DUF2471 domain-containing protein [Cupriavidus neocaledonicus]SPD47481.1 conserved protein of unknown function [Cupriavidus neocaledonicus]
MDPIHVAETAIREAAPAIVTRHRAAGHLTWRLLHQIEDEVVAAVEATRKVNPDILRMMRASPLMGYPKNDERADFGSAGAVAVTFSIIVEAWNHVH